MIHTVRRQGKVLCLVDFVHQLCAYQYRQDLDEIKVSEVDRPLPNSDEYLIQVKAAGVNFVDILYVRDGHSFCHI